MHAYIYAKNIHFCLRNLLKILNFNEKSNYIRSKTTLLSHAAFMHQ